MAPDPTALADAYGTGPMLGQADSASDGGLVRRVRLASCAIAQAVAQEDPTTTNHANRAGYARSVLSNSGAFGEALTWAVLADGSTSSASTDRDLRLRLAVVWDALAGSGP